MGYTLDEHDRKIIQNLWNGRTAYKDVAKKVGLTTNTVRNRVNRMLESGALQIISLVNPASLENHQSAWIGFKVQPQNANAALKSICKLTGVVGASTVSGRFDIMAIVMFNKEHSYQRFLDEELPKVHGLLSSETFFVIGGDSFQLRYVL